MKTVDPILNSHPAFDEMPELGGVPADILARAATSSVSEQELQAVEELDLSQARSHLERGREGHAHSGLGAAYCRLGQYQQAITYYEKCLQIAQQLGDRSEEGTAYSNLGTVYRIFSDFPQAEECYRHSIAVYSRLQHELTEQAEWKIPIFEEQAIAYLGLEEVLLQQGKE